MKKKSVRLIFLGLILLFIAEFIIASKATEPFPAIIYPSFGDIPSIEANTVKKPLVKAYNDTDTIQVENRQLFQNLSNVYSNVILRENFSEDKFFLSEEKQRKQAFIKLGNKRLGFVIEDQKDQKDVIAAQEWLKANLQNTYNRKFTKVEVQWVTLGISGESNDSLAYIDCSESLIIPFE